MLSCVGNRLQPFRVEPIDDVDVFALGMIDWTSEVLCDAPMQLCAAASKDRCFPGVLAEFIVCSCVSAVTSKLCDLNADERKFEFPVVCV